MKCVSAARPVNSCSKSLRPSDATPFTQKAWGDGGVGMKAVEERGRETKGVQGLPTNLTAQMSAPGLAEQSLLDG